VEELKESNRRLKESNDRLLSENNRLEEELAALQKKRAEGEESAPTIASTQAPDAGKAGEKSLEAGDLLIDDDDVTVRNTPQGLSIRVPDRVFFALGQASLTGRGKGVLDKVARLVKDRYPNRMVRVEGHTDDTPIKKVLYRYPTNWELSCARACVVVNYLVVSGKLNAHRIYPAGFSYYRPISNGRSQSAKSQNRRVEIMVLNDRAG
jgi:chemotaxis protein MotB